MANVPDVERESILDVMHTCSVSETQAIHLLQHSKNDPERAKRRHQTLMRFKKPHSNSPARSPVIQPIIIQTPTSHTPTIHTPSSIHELPLKKFPTVETVSVGSSDEGAEEEAPLATPSTEDSPPRLLQPPPVPPRRPNRWRKHGQSSEHLDSESVSGIVNSTRPQPGGLGDGHNMSRDPSRNGQNDQDRMDFQMDHPILITPPASSTQTSPPPLSHRPSNSSSLRQELVSEPLAPARQDAILNLQESWKDEARSSDVKPREEVQQEPIYWDFVLPTLPAPMSLVPGQGGVATSFSIPDLVGALQHGANEHAVQTYLQYFDDNTIRRHINDAVSGFPSIFYAVATNNDRILRLWIKYGGDVNAIHTPTRAPLLAFAIMHGETIEADTSHIVATLLSLNASPLAIPALFYTPYFRDLPDGGPEDEELKDVGHETMQWLGKDVRAKLARNIHLTHRYNLDRAAKIPKPSVRHWQIAHRKNAEALLGLPYFLIGQSMASTRLLQQFLSHLAVPTKKPLVLVFAGPSGHGKTELARRLGYLMNLELEVVDCTIVTREMELFGGRHPYVNADQGTPLNNFLARNHGQRSIVFLDEFEKTTSQIHQALLLPFDNGEYQDRRTLSKIDCSQTIWILATNALDNKIKSFCQVHGGALFTEDNETEQTRLLKTLSKELREDFLSKFDAPITGRISAFLPFLLFSPGEQAVIAHKYLLELGHDVRSPVNLTTGAEERLIGNVRLRIRRDASVCKNIAEEGYHPELGARSLTTAINSVRTLLVQSYLSVDEAITESDGLVDFIVDINGGEIVASMAERV